MANKNSGKQKPASAANTVEATSDALNQDQLDELVDEIEDLKKPLTGAEIEAKILEILPKEKEVRVEFLKPIAGIKAGHQKTLPVSLAKRMETRGDLKII
jgi:DNA-directed RNA polymerase subunit F